MVDHANPSEEHQMLREMIRDFTQEFVEPQAHEFDKKEEFNLELFRQLGDLGLLGITVPEEYGGSGLDVVAATIAHEELSYSDPGFTLAYLAHSMLFVNNLAQNGSEEQKNRILPKVCSGEWIGAMAMSEPDAGTDVLGLSTTAQKNDSGDWILNGRKMWITNGCIDDREHLPTSFGSMLAPDTMKKDVHSSLRSSLKRECKATVLARKSSTKQECVLQTLQNLCSMIVLFLAAIWLEKKGIH